MTVDYSAWAEEVRRLHAAVSSLGELAQQAGAHGPQGREWFSLLEHRLLPQLETKPLLVVAVVGGTNIGKSALFNQMAGEVASAVSPLAAGTRHPVCLVPPGFGDEPALARIFEGFELAPWRSPQDPLDDSQTNKLFWRVGRHVPPRLLLLDTPDVDSDVAVNWDRAEAIRRVADVLVAVLTQQKYNDAAVKRFFRKAAEADKPFLVVFNQCDLKADRTFWPLWLSTFVRETGARPEFVYIVPHDRRAADALELPFFAANTNSRDGYTGPVSLRDDLAHMHFDAIKIRTFRGALSRVLDPRQGAPAYLDELRIASAEHKAAKDALSASEMARVSWPTLPPPLLVEEIRSWWDDRRSRWSRRVHGFYRGVGRVVVWPVAAAWEAFSGSAPDPVAAFVQRERIAILGAVDKLFDELQRLARLGNDALRPRLEAVLGGDARSRLLAQVEANHAALPPVDDDYRQFLRGELDRWASENARAVSWLRSLDHAGAIARPAITVSLAVSGWIVAGGIVHDVAVQAAGHTITQLATEAALTGGITGGGEMVVSTAGEGLHRAAVRLFGRLQSRYTERRAGWLAQWLEQELLGDVLAGLRRGAELPLSEPFQEVEAAIARLAAASRRCDGR